jgi:hypothetical protein
MGLGLGLKFNPTNQTDKERHKKRHIDRKKDTQAHKRTRTCAHRSAVFREIVAKALYGLGLAALVVT